MPKKALPRIDESVIRELLRVGSGFLLVVLVLVLADHYVIQPTFLHLEEKQVREDCARVLGDIENGQAAITASVNDWANWDATYAFALDRNARYIEETSPDPAVLSQDSGIDLLAIFDRQGDILLQSVFLPSLNRPVSLQILTGEKPAILATLAPVLQRGSPLDGFLATEHGLLLISARPILPNSKQGDSRGALIMGRFLAGKSLDAVARRTRVPLTLLIRDDPGLSQRDKSIFAELAARTARPQEYQDGSYFYRLLHDVSATPVGLIRVSQRGDIVLLGRQTGRMLLALLIFGSLVFAGFLVGYRIRIVRNLADLRRSEQDLRTSEELFRSIVSASPMGMHFYQVNNLGQLVLTAANPAADRILGIDHRPLLGKTVAEAFPDLGKSHIPDMYIQVATGEKGQQFFEIPYDDGRISGIYEVYVFQTGRNSVAATYLDVSDRKKMEMALQESEARYARIISATSDAIWEWDLSTDKAFFSPRWFEMLGYADQELPMTFETWKDLCFLADHVVAVERIKETLASSGAVKYRAEIRMRAKNGEWRWILARGDVGKRDEQGKPLLLVGTHVDITDRKLAEENLWRERQNLRAILRASPLPTLIFDAEERIVDANRAAEELFGSKFVDVRYKRCGDFLGSVNRLEDPRGCGKSIRCPECLLAESIKESLVAGKGVRDRETMVRMNELAGPRTLWLQFSIEPFEVDEQSRLIVVLHDITERKMAESALRESEAKYRSLTETTSMGIWYLDAAGKTTHINPAMCEMLEIDSVDELQGETYHRFFSEESLPILTKEHDLRLAGLKTTYEAVLVGNRGTRRNVLITGAPLYDQNHQMIGKIGTIADITDLRQAEVTADREKVFSAEVINSMPGVFYMYDDAFRLVRWNRRHEEVLGYSAEELRNKHVLDFFDAENKAVINGGMRKAFTEGTGYVEALITAKDGGKIPYFFTGRSVTVEGKQYLIGVGVDISDRKFAEEEHEKLHSQLQQAQKMESVGRLAGGVAHDFNNMLGVIIGYAELAQRQIEAESPIRKYLDQIRSAAERSANLTQQLLAFARKQTIAPKILDLNEMVEGMLKMLRRLIGEEIDLAWLPGANLGKVEMDPSQIDQMLVNLCINARDAITGNGKITIETANISFDDAYCSAHEGFRPGEHVALIVSDTGCGMDKETIKGIFEPFFTTKVQGQGTGLGLAMVYGIVKQNNASINVYSEPGRGTTFKIYLPSVVGEEDQQAQAGSEVLPYGRGETILLVEDEQTIMEMARAMLLALRYEILVATSPDEGLRLAREHDGPIDLLLTDVVMPGMNGRQLQEKILTVRPLLRCLFMSGYTADVIAHQGVLDEGLSFLQKPFSLQVLALRVREVLDQVHIHPA